MILNVPLRAPTFTIDGKEVPSAVDCCVSMSTMLNQDALRIQLHQRVYDKCGCAFQDENAVTTGGVCSWLSTVCVT